jgi:hypothetical protein
VAHHAGIHIFKIRKGEEWRWGGPESPRQESGKQRQDYRDEDQFASPRQSAGLV